MSNDPIPAWQRDRLALLLDRLGDVPVSDPERSFLTWLAGFGRPSWRTSRRGSSVQVTPRAGG
ncbi:MAG: hypothetical protein ACRDRI_12270 [Pseudonocardiaceae bacterium]